MEGDVEHSTHPAERTNLFLSRVAGRLWMFVEDDNTDSRRTQHLRFVVRGSYPFSLGVGVAAGRHVGGRVVDVEGRRRR